MSTPKIPTPDRTVVPFSNVCPRNMATAVSSSVTLPQNGLVGLHSISVDSIVRLRTRQAMSDDVARQQRTVGLNVATLAVLGTPSSSLD